MQDTATFSLKEWKQRVMEWSQEEITYQEEIIALLRQKYLKLDSIYELTKQIGESFQHNDQATIQMLLSMRLEEMIEVDGIDEKISNTSIKFSLEGQKRIMNILSHKGCSLEDDSEKRIRDIYEKLMRILEKTIALDKNLSIKMSGNQSYYTEKNHKEK